MTTLLALLLAACGGGGGGDEATSTPLIPGPTVDARANGGSQTSVPTALGPPIEGTPVIGAVVWATAINPTTKAPVTTVDAFSVDDVTLFAVLPVRNLVPGTELVGNWTYNDTSLDGVSSRLVVGAGIADGWVEFHLARAPDAPWPDGTYAIAVQIGGETLQSAAIEVRNG
jgi:hypothetical protein